MYININNKNKEDSYLLPLEARKSTKRLAKQENYTIEVE